MRGIRASTALSKSTEEIRPRVREGEGEGDIPETALLKASLALLYCLVKKSPTELRAFWISLIRNRFLSSPASTEAIPTTTINRGAAFILSDWVWNRLDLLPKTPM